jgi:organic radical activating enzyme
VARTAILYVTERCNQACVFCLEEDGTALRPDVPATQVAADLASLRARGADHLTFMGGETFLRKDLPSLLDEARRLGFTRRGVTTNGTALAHPGFLEKMIDAGLDFVELSVHADSAELAEEISGKGFTWERQQRAIDELENLRDRLHVIVNLVICRQNAGKVAEILRTLLDGHPRLRPMVKLKFVSVIGAASRDGSPPLRYDEVDLRPALALLKERGIDYWLYNFPLCVVPGEAARSHEAQAFALDWRYHDYDHRARDGYYDSGFQLEGNVWPEACDRCTLAPLCPGMEETYRRFAGEGELKAQSESALPYVEQILDEAKRDRTQAPVLLAALQQRNRPRRFVPELAPKPGEAALVFKHPAWDEPLAFELSPADEKRPSFAATPRLRLAYRKAAREPGGDPDGRRLLDALVAQLGQADAEGDPIAVAATRLAAAGAPGWSCATVKLGPAPPDPTRPLSIRVPSRP